MKKSTKKIVKHLQRYVGIQIIRINPNVEGDYTYTDRAVILVGFTENGAMIVKLTKFGNEWVLSNVFTDYMWIPYSQALLAKNNRLNEWRGKRTKRKIMNSMEKFCKDRFLLENTTLLSASRHHVFFETKYGGVIILGSQYAKFSEWELAE